ncbi:cupin 2 conserved barrel domain protein (plasmid) [Streptantibioticus cattleyicolor NRRL 8057 = DSM 46488]|uniref:Cupin 2 conserved barrel domain protein n=2 Tax=Streptantibioticus cattleyicolor TaxID=29303 RepID=G8XEW6_STREN|nr:cupin 2 conserved barrel domain protein [Streptantibioticus cattleyicolor NRRL 8057 = DSM 46488]
MESRLTHGAAPNLIGMARERTTEGATMSGTRIAGGVVAAGVVAAAIVLAPGARHATATAPSGAAATRPPAETLTPLLQQPLPNAAGKTFTSVIVDFPPKARAVPHRHGAAFVYAYVLEGAVRSRLAGEPARTYRKGEQWVERPGAHHLLAENTSRTGHAKLLVVFVSRTGDRLKTDDRPRAARLSGAG